jgi:uncharacterized Rossmann fold enzyme
VEQEGLDQQRRSSRAAFLRRFPELAGQIPEEPVTAPLLDGATPVDIRIGSARLYRGDGRELARTQVRDYLANPTRVYRALPVGENLGSGIGREMATYLFDRVKQPDIGFDALPAQPDYPGAMLIVFGVGLGYHLPDLIAGTRAGRIVLVEPYPEFFSHSFGAIDWTRLLEDVERRGGRLHVITASQPAPAVAEIAALLAGTGSIYLDGLFLFSHYPAEILTTVRAEIAKYYDMLYLGYGFFEDERVMLTNTVANLERQTVRLLAQPQARRPEPAFVIGSGPSVDADIAELRRLGGRAVVFSCGSALLTCLKNGIIPDFHVDDENVAAVYDALEHTGRQYDISGLTLVASLTVDPRVPPLFNKTILYHKGAVSCSRILDLPGEPLQYCYPTVGNAGLAVAITLGFTEIYLFGLDFGSREVARKHARDTIYQEMAAMIKAEQAVTMPYQWPGNFGGTIHTNDFLHQARAYASTLIRSRPVRVFNCSDGGAIEGAEPKRSTSLRLRPLRDGTGPVRDRVIEALPCFPPGALLGGYDRGQLAAARDRLLADLDTVIEDALAGPPEILAFWAALQPLLDADGYRGVQRVFAGTLWSMARFASFFLFRLPDTERRQRLFTDVLVKFREITRIMGQGSTAIFPA